MSIARTLLLAASRNHWLSRELPRRRFVRRAVRRFLPGEEVEDALRTAAELATQGIGSLYTQVGENVTTLSAAAAEVSHYLDAMDSAAARGLSAWPSIKLTHLGLDLDVATCERNLLQLAERAADRGAFLWIDMEDSSYVDATLRIYERARALHERIGVCLQAYLRRTGDDLDRLLSTAPAIRLVKGAYAERETVAYPRKRDVDAAYFALGARLLEAAGRGAAFPVFGTHDVRLISRLQARAAELGVAPPAYEFHLLYGIGTDDQLDLARQGESVRVLISYGRDWFPWYMRRLAERPANVWFVVRHLFG